MRTGEAFPSKHLKAADLQGRRLSVVIDRVVVEDVGDDRKPVVYFKNKERGMALNVTNANMIAEITGTDEMDDWTGRAIVLYVAKVDYQGRRVDAIRVDYPPKTAAPLPPPPPVHSAPLTDDDIPF